MQRVIITDFIHDDLLPERTVLSGIAEVEALNAHDEDAFVGRIESANAIMMYHNISLTRRTIERLQDCKLIVRCGVGFDNVDFAFARQRGIPVANVPDYGTEEVADSAIGMMLTMVRGIHLYNTRMREHPAPWMYTVAGPLYRLRGRTFAVIGLGRIGMATAIRAKALGMDVVFYDPYKQDGYDKTIGIRRAESVDELLSQAFVLSIHCPLSSKTKNMIDAEAIDRLPKGAYLVNTARGAIVDTSAIPDALVSGRLAGAAIDVLVGEPPLPDNPLLVAWRDPKHPAYERLIINPHAAFYSEQGLMDMRIKGVDACRRALLGLELRNVIN